MQLDRHLQVQNCNTFLEVRICWFLFQTVPFVNTVVQCSSLTVAPKQCCYLGFILKVFIYLTVGHSTQFQDVEF